MINRSYFTYGPVLTFLTVCLVAIPAFGTTLCVGPSATGNGSGSDWNNQAAWGSVAFTRGNTYYLANGSYTSRTLNTANSGTTYITIKKAVAADHVTGTGWSDAMTNQAVFSGIMYFSSSYWILDGQVGAGASVSPPDTTPGNYGFAFSSSSYVFLVGVPSVVINNVSVMHIYSPAVGSDVEKVFFAGYYGGGSFELNNARVAYCLIDGFQNGFMTKGQGSHSYSGLVWEYNICLNGFSSSLNHGEWINANEQALNSSTIRYNVFKGYSGSSGMTDSVVANNSSMDGILIYGNVFDNLRVGAGCIGPNHGNFSNGLIYNNTFLNFTSDSGPWLGNIQAEGTPVSSVAYNNLVYNQKGAHIAAWTSDYNAFFSATSIPGEANQQVATGNPFNNSPGMVYTLSANTSGGTPLGSPYNVDALGHTRTTWSRGAYEYGSNNTNPIISVSPSKLDFGTVVTNTISQLSFTVQNVGIGTLTGAVKVSAPFSIVSGAMYSLSANQSQSVTVLYSPVMEGSNSQTVIFSGGGGATATQSGVAINTNSASLPTPTAYWNFNEGTGSAAADGVSTNTLILQNSATWNTNGMFGAGLSLSGVNGYAKTPNSPQLDLNGSSMSIAAWVNLQDQGTWQQLVAKVSAVGTFTSPYFSWHLFGSSLSSSQWTPHFQVVNSGGTSVDVGSSMNANYSEWVHVVGVYDGVAVHIYVNGVDRGSAAQTGNIISYQQPLFVGAHGLPGEFAKGVIDEVRVYSGALSAAQVQALYNYRSLATLSPPSPPSGLRFIW